MSENDRQNKPYRVLARKYRPQNFSELIGQDALVRTLTNAIESGRIAHAYMLTGIRGTGKTTTARIIAKALNYKGPDGTGAPTAGPTDDCEICQAITEDRHPDVMEMDAASRTGIDDIREILEGVRYAPVSARYKVYIIDEVHMLSKNAFNALLKTLEEPPEHVIFIFATTEIRKVPVTVLSRCQRFDLRRIDAQTLADYYKMIAEKEGAKIEDEALMMIGRAADGSVRDGLSLLDQAIAKGTETDDGIITARQTQDMLGLADRGLILDILEAAMKGDCAKALDILTDLYAKAADPSVVIGDMLDLVHLMTRYRAAPDMKETGDLMAGDMLERLKDLSGKLSMPALGKAWQLLLKCLGEVAQAPNPQAAAEMAIIRLAYTAELPDPAELLRKLKDGDENKTAVSANVTPAAQAAATRTTTATTTGTARSPAASTVSGSAANSAVAVQDSDLDMEPQANIQNDMPQENVAKHTQTLADIEALLMANGEVRLAGELHHNVHLVRMKENLLEMRIGEMARQEFPQELTRALRKITGNNWMITLSSAAGMPTLAEQTAQFEAIRIEGVKNDINIAKVIELFPDAKIRIVEKS